MPYQFPKPEMAAISSMYSALFGRKVTVNNGVRMSTTPRDAFTAATFRDEKGELIGMAAFDLPLSASLGAALSLIPPHTVKKIVKAGEFDEMTWDNLHEVYNISTRFFHDAFYSEMVALERVFKPKELPRDLMKYLRRSAHRHDMSCNVHGYGEGKFTFVSNC